jgi:HPr kinase/phosphorylase
MTRHIGVGSLLGARGAGHRLDFDLLAGAAGLDRRISQPYVQKTGLALAGDEAWIEPGQIVVFGRSEVEYLSRMEPAARTNALRRILQRDLPAIVLTSGLDGPPELSAEAERAGVPLLRTALPASVAGVRLTALLEDRLAPREMQHGVLLDLFGLGVLLVGESGIGKSECAVELIARGHRLVADDTVEVRRRAEAILIGTCPELTRHHVEIRGLGLVNVMDLFGVSATRSSKRVELVVRLERWEHGREYDRLGLDLATTRILDVEVPLVAIPIAPGRNVAILVEVAARNQLLRARGRDAARLLAGRLERRLEVLGDREGGPDEGEDF